MLGAKKRLQAFDCLSKAAKDACDGVAQAQLSDEGLFTGASKLVRAFSKARQELSDRILIALEEAVAFMHRAVDCAADGADCHSLRCAEKLIGLISLLGPVGSLDPRQRLVGLQAHLALPGWWADGQVTHQSTNTLCKHKGCERPLSAVAH